MILWIDSLCINQLDLLELNSQVNKIRDIYNSAIKVVAWLGEDDEYSIAAKKFIKKMFDAGLQLANPKLDGKNLLQDYFCRPESDFE